MSDDISYEMNRFIPVPYMGSRVEQIREAFRMASQLAVEILSVDHLEVIDLAAQARLTTYDASYLWLARKTGGELVTLDKRLFKASGRLVTLRR